MSKISFNKNLILEYFSDNITLLKDALISLEQSAPNYLNNLTYNCEFQNKEELLISLHSISELTSCFFSHEISHLILEWENDKDKEHFFNVKNANILKTEVLDLIKDLNHWIDSGPHREEQDNKSHFAPSPNRILVIDDDLIHSKIIMKKLSNAGFIVKHIPSGEEAINLLNKKSEHFDLILLDIIMPGISGIGTLKYIRNLYQKMDLPIIMMTVQTDPTDIVDSLKIGANDYITKPANFDVALSRIQSQIHSSQLHKQSLENARIDAVNAMIITYNHEINNPLTIVMNEVERISRTKEIDMSTAMQSLKRIRSLMKKIDAITNKDIKFKEYVKDCDMLDIG